MPLSAGDKLGPYEVLSPIGAGGMGEVYKARDTRLNRTVAIKVLPEHIARREDGRARFEREARAVASLNHPHICTLHDIGNQDGAGYIVMEYLEGETLAAHIGKGALPLDRALELATQIADALDRAHRAGVTHRDVKPQNIMLTRDGVKVLDFGLAKSSSKPAPTEETLTAVLTTEDTVMGTPQYMAPEQFEGKEADARSDIWAFGAVLYETVTGQKAFQGKSYSSLVGAILSADPAPMALKPFTPAWLERLVRRCLAKDPEDRWQSIRDVVLELRTPVVEGVAAGPSKTARWPPALAAAFALTAVVLGVAYWRAVHPSGTPLKPLIRLDANLGPGAVPGADSSVAISPDGTRIVFPIRRADGKQLLAMRLLEQAAIRPLPGTEGGSNTFFSPDGQWIGFTADSKLKKVSLRGGAPVTLSDLSTTVFASGSWGENGDIVTGNLSTTGGLQRIPASGGAPHAVTKFSDQEGWHLLPQVLPGSEAVLFTAVNPIGQIEDATIQVVSLKTGAVKTLLSGGYLGRYLPTDGSTGHLVYIHQGALYAVSFDPVRLEVRGRPEQILDDVAGMSGTMGIPFDLSTNGILVYRPRTVDDRWPIVWMDGSGKIEPLVTTPGKYFGLRFSPDGKRFALDAHTGKGQEIFVYDRQRGALSRLTFAGGLNLAPVWSPDGEHLVFASRNAPASRFNWIRADGSREMQVLWESKTGIVATGFSPDGQRLGYQEVKPDGDRDIWTLPLDISDPEHPKPGKPVPFLQTPAVEAWLVFSPDGRYVAYISNESGRYEIYVRQAPGRDGKPAPGKWQVSTGGGMYPEWSPNGRELFYLDFNNHRIMVTDYSASRGSFSSGKPRVWSDRQIRRVGNYRNFAVAADGKRVAVFPMPEDTAQDKGAAHVTFLLNFSDEVRRKMPVGN